MPGLFPAWQAGDLQKSGAAEPAAVSRTGACGLASFFWGEGKRVPPDSPVESRWRMIRTRMLPQSCEALLVSLVATVFDSPLRNSTTFLATPAVSRKTCGSNATAVPFFLILFGFIFKWKRHLLLCLAIPPPASTLTTSRVLPRTVQKRTVNVFECLPSFLFNFAQTARLRQWNMRASLTDCVAC